MTAMDAGGGWRRFSVASGLLVRRKTDEQGDDLRGLAHGLADDDEVLLVGNDYSTRGSRRTDLTWSLPGGRLEPGEDHRTALRREYAEETGLTVEVGDVLYINEALTPRGRVHFVSVVMMVRAVGDAVAHVPPGEEAVAAVRWVAARDVGGLIRSPSLGEALLNYLHDPATAARHYVYPDYTIYYAPDGSMRPLLSWPPKTSSI